MSDARESSVLLLDLRGLQGQRFHKPNVVVEILPASLGWRVMERHYGYENVLEHWHLRLAAAKRHVARRVGELVLEGYVPGTVDDLVRRDRDAAA